MIIVQNPGDFLESDLLNNLWDKDFEKIEDEPFEAVINPDDEKVYFGTYNGNLIICDSGLSMKFFDMPSPVFDEMFTKQFPNSEICFVALHSVVNLWAYGILKNGHRLRVRAGSADDGTYMDEGEPLPEEIQLLSTSHINSGGNRVYRNEEFPDQEMSEDQVGEEFVFSICSRYFGDPLDRLDDSFLETMFSGYATKRKSVGRDRSTVAPKVNLKPKPWWKFW